ncbi:tRNA (adenosine(37)-N6)-threonylcarbamoyltransferase complex ATPase subunit type 1 TsaE [Lacinutrix sp. Bg11-31]|uniref:tRNA (adenosine(37)-N6)-threonylcarbamoyltransferase complex ATPase subunit type 1 TsaE n=1 Tax=Lacinutrix sp. Bg11-31 TaxID=2057808 RepID=UPI000C317ED2|nr:tRNA (adenosine(37)-N6)-threonylcarbamoyltransferase complex ATPase subunit type 1 TsaE [Lacinutrix sp. Bg11-31]AUC81342.1 tRNA (adenosine(37)-N6)-threonylcarbamoyltransferase complex ATPase subunit type 1 TsaE [Lacinutrix sp. Bg11-31]
MLEIEYTLKDIDNVAKQVLKHATTKYFLFKAEMGAGKTTLIKALVKILGCNDTVSSPTFSLVNEYQSKNETIYHFDLYRVEDESELYDFGIEEYLNSGAYLFIEWPELAKDLIETYNCITISVKNDTSRILKMT